MICRPPASTRLAGFLRTVPNHSHKCDLCQLNRAIDRLGAGGPRRRFAQDGEIPVTVPHGRREHPAEAPINRLEAAEIATTAERTACDSARRCLELLVVQNS
jgi:hypothetical protein